MHFINLNTILDLLKVYKYLIIFPISILEGPIITILSGLLVSLGSVNLYVVFVVLVFGDVTGDTLYYAIGRFGRNGFIKRWGKFFGIEESKIIHFESQFKKREVSILLIAKTQPIGSIALTTAGFVKMRFDTFLIVNTFGTMVKTAILLVIGFYFGQAYNSIDNYITRIGIIATFALVVCIVAYIFYYKRKKK